MTTVSKDIDLRQLHARAHLAVEVADGRSRVTECWGEPPLVPRQTTAGISFVGGAAGPMGGDVLTTMVEVGENASLAVGSVAASYARPGPNQEVSTARVNVRVARLGRLYWAPEPLVAVTGCCHQIHTTIDLENGAEIFWVDVTVLGRHGEPGGEVWSRRSLDLAGRPFNRQEIAMGLSDRRTHDPAVLGGARVIASCLVVHPEWNDDLVSDEADVGAHCPKVLTEVGPSVRAGLLHLPGPGVEIIGLGQSFGGVLGAWQLLARRIFDQAPATSGLLERYVNQSR